MAVNQVRVRTGPLPTGLALKDAATKGTKRVMAGAKIRQGISAIKAHPGKAGMALAGLAAAGGLGVAGMKALSARKKKASSFQGKAQSALGSAKKKFKGIGIG